jgi:hypothetical protein
MRTLLSTVAGLGAAALMAAMPVAAIADQSLGIYQTTDRKMDFGLNRCGSSGKNLCVTLLAARGSADVPQVHPYLGKLAVNNATPTGPDRWKGHIVIQGFSGDGTLTLNPGTNFIMHGCTMVVVCADFTLIPALKQTAAP